MMASQSNPRLSFASYNCRGINDQKVDYVRELMNVHDVLFIQEHWRLDEGLSLLERQLQVANVFGKSGMDATCMLTGRPFGGCAVLVKKTLQCTVSPIDTNNRRLFSCILRFPNDISFLLHCVYMPNDTCFDVSNIELFNDILIEIDFVNVSHENVQHIMIAGDFNTDLDRARSLHTESLLDFCEHRDFVICKYLDVANVDFSYSNACMHVSSLIDHFVISESLVPSVMRFECIHHGHNLSDHCAVALSLCDVMQHVPCNNSRNDRLRFSWAKANEIDVMVYKYTLSECLRAIELPVDILACDGLNCECIMGLIDEYYDAIINACLKAANCAIPKPGRRAVAGWSEHVKPYKERSMLWYRLWLENDKPDSGVVYDCMIKAKRDYKRVVRWVLRNQEKLGANKMAEALLARRERDFWTEVSKKSKGSGSSANYIDDATGVEEIGQLFSDKFNELYNSVPYDESEMYELKCKIEDQLTHQCSRGRCYHEHRVDAGDVLKAVHKLKRGKADVCDGITSDCFKNACDELFVHISFLFNAMITHCYAPAPFLSATIVPIPKNARKSRNDSANYRSIAIGNVIGKIFDKIVLVKHACILDTSALQFGFKSKHSTVQCTFVFNEIVQKYVSQGSPCYAVLLDATKAFDRVHFVKLFSLLLERSMCPTIIKLLLFMYTNQCLSVRWQSATTDPFSCANGIKRGGVLSPVLFCLYMDEVLRRLKQLDIGCRIGDIFAGALCYADDLCLLAPSRGAAQRMLSVCEHFAQEYNVAFNAKKSKLLVFQPLTSNAPSNANTEYHAPLTLCGNNIVSSETELYLGNIVGKNSHAKSIGRAIQDLLYRTNVLMSRFYYCPFDIRLKLFYTYCSSFYGSPLFSFFGNEFHKLCVTWNKCLKKVCKLNMRTRTCLISPLTRKPDLKTQLLLRFCTYIKKCLSSENPLIRAVTFKCHNSFTCVGQNFRALLGHLNLDFDIFNCKSLDVLINQLRNVFCTNMITEEIIAHCDAIHEIRMFLDGDLTIPNFDIGECRDLLYLLCTCDIT